jgi:TetR/AcrR family transcriptional repressor of nem operon
MYHLNIQEDFGRELMRRSSEEKAETRDAIVTQASRLFREHGIDGTSVADVMGAAKLTHGGFYRHFETKEALLEAAMGSAFDEILTMLDTGFAKGDSADALKRFARSYLSSRSVEDVGQGCPVAALSGDVSRSSEAIQDSFGLGARRMVEAIASALDGPPSERMRRAAQAFAMAAGALMIARASDPKTAELILSAARSGVADL